MTIRSVTEAKAELSALLVRVEQGEEVVISRAGKPVAKLVSFGGSEEPRRPGALRCKVWTSDDFDDFDPEIAKMFYGEEEVDLLDRTSRPDSWAHGDGEEK